MMMPAEQLVVRRAICRKIRQDVWLFSEFIVNLQKKPNRNGDIYPKRDLSPTVDRRDGEWRSEGYKRR